MGESVWALPGVKMKFYKYFLLVIILLIPQCALMDSFLDTFSNLESSEDRQLSTTVSENIVPIFFLVLIATILNNLLFGGLAAASTPSSSRSAVCTFGGEGTGSISGTVAISQDSASSDATFKLNLSGLTPGKHGFHVHQNGDLGNNCKAAGGHYNPYNKNHGAPTASDRHVGCLGNIEADSDGNVSSTFTDHLATLLGDIDITGRSLVIHEGEDDLGLGGNAESLITGNAGARLGCCIIVEDNGNRFVQTLV